MKKTAVSPYLRQIVRWILSSHPALILDPELEERPRLLETSIQSFLKRPDGYSRGTLERVALLLFCLYFVEFCSSKFKKHRENKQYQPVRN